MKEVEWEKGAWRYCRGGREEESAKENEGEGGKWELYISDGEGMKVGRRTESERKRKKYQRMK